MKLASRIVSRTGFLAGFNVQDSPLYGAERRGAPVVAFTWVSESAIRERGYIQCPDVAVVLDESLLSQPEAAVLDGLSPEGIALVNSTAAAEALRARYGIAAHVVSCDVSAVVLATLGHHVLSAPIAGITVKVAVPAGWDLLAEAVRIELAAIGLAPAAIEHNLVATRQAFDLAPAFGFSPRAPLGPVSAGPLFVIPHLSARLVAPSIEAPATSARRSVEGWRVSRPSIETARCTRCSLCFALCPEGAIALDAEQYPVVDYDHCKGCLVCVSECPPHAIREVREVAA